MTTIEQAYIILEETKEILDELEIPFWLDGGTLLGFIRDDTFCEDDHRDIDVSTWCNYKEKIPLLINTFIKKGYILHNHWHWNDKAHEVSVIKEGIKVDIFFKERKSAWSWHCLYSSKEPVRWKRNSIIYFNELKEITIKGNIYKVPKDCAGYLEELYGEWITPINRKEWSCYNKGNAFIERSWCE